MNFNTKAILSVTLVLLCGISVDGHAKSKKKGHKNKPTENHSKPKNGKGKRGGTPAYQPEDTIVQVPTPPVATETLTPPIESSQEAVNEKADEIAEAAIDTVEEVAEVAVEKTDEVAESTDQFSEAESEISHAVEERDETEGKS